MKHTLTLVTMLLAPPAALFGFLSFLPSVSSAEPPSPLHPKPEAAPTFEWAISAGGTLHDKTRGMALDAEGNVLLTGEFTGTATFGEHSLTSVGAMDFFVAKVDSRGKFLWVRSGGGEKIDRGYALATDPAGNCYVTGHYESTEAKFEKTIVKNGGEYDLFVAKYDPKGNLAWIQSGGGSGYDCGHGIATDKHGNVFVTGAVVGEGRFVGEKLGHAGPAHAFCLAMSSEGQLLWSHTADGTGSSSGHGVAADQQGNCYVGGYASGASTFGGQKINNTAGQDVLVAKFDSRGKPGWLHAGHGSSSAMIHEITADAEGNVWASGMFKNELKLADRAVTSQGQQDLLLTSFDSSGKRLWTKTAGATGIDYGLGDATDGKGNCFLTGSFTGKVEFDGTPRTSAGAASDIMVVKYRAGVQRWFVQAGSDRTDHAYTIVSDGKGNLYFSGACSGAAKFGEHTLPHRGSNDIFLAKLTEKPLANKKN